MEDPDFFVLYNIFARTKNRQTSTKNPKMKRKRCQGRRACTAGFLPRDPGKVYQASRGVLPWTPPGNATGYFWRTSKIQFFYDFSIWLKTNTNQQQSKSEAKSIPREAKVQEWFGESRLWEGLPDLEGGVFLSLVPA